MARAAAARLVRRRRTKAWKRLLRIAAACRNQSTASTCSAVGRGRRLLRLHSSGEEGGGKEDAQLTQADSGSSWSAIARLVASWPAQRAAHAPTTDNIRLAPTVTSATQSLPAVISIAASQTVSSEISKQGRA
jgi:hypothetical protein